MENLPIGSQDTVFDLGCSIGTVSGLLAQQAKQVIGIDLNQDLLDEAKRTNPFENIHYLLANLKNLDEEDLPLADGIWSSFVAAYFPDFDPILAGWAKLLRPNGWIALVEINDLFGHFPLSPETQRTFRDYYARQKENRVYDFEMGKRIRGILENNGFNIIHEEKKSDQELTQSGPVTSQVRKAWENRLDRMLGFQDYLGKERFAEIKREFLDCLSSENHLCKTEINYIIGRK